MILSYAILYYYVQSFDHFLDQLKFLIHCQCLHHHLLFFIEHQDQALVVHPTMHLSSFILNTYFSFNFSKSQLIVSFFFRFFLHQIQMPFFLNYYYYHHYQFLSQNHAFFFFLVQNYCYLKNCLGCILPNFIFIIDLFSIAAHNTQHHLHFLKPNLSCLVSKNKYKFISKIF